MPELPEVETIKRGLAPFIKGKKILEVEMLRPKLIKGMSPSIFAKKVKGDTILGIERRAKYLLVPLKSGNTLIFHLGMTGALLKSVHKKPLSKTGEEAQKYIRISGNVILDFSDLRLFGKIWLVPSKKVLEQKEIKKLGVEPFSKAFTLDWFTKELAKRKTKIKLLIMDQAFVVGVGNIYANEVLYRAGIHPARPANKITPKEAKKLHHEIIDVLSDAIKHGGSSVDNYVDAEGGEGTYGKLHKVYDRKGEPCTKCRGVVQKISLGQRGTYFCPKCQK
ncbi:MAG: bifunctional DNA-formamidopyrimidine glycosylase/DNA-(apurinic or apyrimidinic site) lyase [Candidatus Saganbacteria bacterium]|nr:bifunctional DNA-formamidopyrimidine glycosylase/DNA-(apurinic or apyrimidinic site) lyase [Candidatus Saganbacteria bacterium]